MTMDESTHDGTIRLTVPSYPQFVRVARLTAAGALSLGGYSMRFVDDVRAALSEACALVMGEVGHPGNLAMVLEMRDDALDVEVCGEFATAPDRDETADRLSRRLLEPLVDHFHVDLAHNRLTFSKTGAG